jgi:hypothetical protein
MYYVYRAASPLTTQNDLSGLLSGIVDSFQSATATYVQNLFSGQGNHPSELANLLSHGQWLDFKLGTSNTQSLYDMKTIMMNTFYGLLLPKAWRDNPNVHPFIL